MSEEEKQAAIVDFMKSKKGKTKHYFQRALQGRSPYENACC